MFISAMSYSCSISGLAYNMVLYTTEKEGACGAYRTVEKVYSPDF